jgi:hypothetical protein
MDPNLCEVFHKIGLGPLNEVYGEFEGIFTCGIMVNASRKSCNPMEQMSTPSIRIWPEHGSTMRKRANVNDDLPLIPFKFDLNEFSHLPLFAQQFQLFRRIPLRMSPPSTPNPFQAYTEGKHPEIGFALWMANFPFHILAFSILAHVHFEYIH